jgi:hypothetical protein
MNYAKFILPSAQELAEALSDAYLRGERCSPEVAEALREALMPGPQCPSSCPYRLKRKGFKHLPRNSQEAVEVSLKLGV